MSSEAIQCAQVEHAKLHMRQDHIRMHLLDQLYSPHLDTSIATAILECGHCQNFRPMHVHSLLAPVTQWLPIELLVGNYLSMPPGEGGFTKIGLYANANAQSLWAYKLKLATGKNTVDSLRQISQGYMAPWNIHGLLNGSDKILLNALKLCTPGLGEDDYKKMTKKDILSNWPGHLDTAV